MFKKYSYPKVKRTHSWLFILTIQQIMYVQIETFFTGSTKSLTDMIKRKDGRYMLSRSTRYRSSRELQQSKKKNKNNQITHT